MLCCLAFSVLTCFTRKQHGEEETHLGSYQSESRYYLHVQLTGIEPPIWRKMVVPGAISLHTLHKMLQVVMGWENTHLYLFRLTINEKTSMRPSGPIG